MSVVEIKGYTSRDFSLVNHLKVSKQMQLGHKFSYNVMYAQDCNCKGELSVEMFDRDAPEDFVIKLTLDGFFTYTANTEKEKVHIESFNALYPYARAIISSATALCGLPPVLLPFVDITKQEIYRFDKNPPSKI